MHKQIKRQTKIEEERVWGIVDIVKEGTHTYLLSVIEHKEILNKELLDNERSDNEISDKDDVGFEIKQNMTDCGVDYYLSVEYVVL